MGLNTNTVVFLQAYVGDCPSFYPRKNPEMKVATVFQIRSHISLKEHLFVAMLLDSCDIFIAKYNSCCTRSILQSFFDFYFSILFPQALIKEIL